jgi:hypothetical protein
MKGLRKSRKDSDKRAVGGAALAAGFATGGTIFVLGALGAGVALGIPRLQARLASGVQERPAKAAFTWPAVAADKSGKAANATWLPVAVQQDLLSAAQRRLDTSPDPFSPAALSKIAEVAAGSGWFEQITAVRREEGVVRVEGQWRIPAAVVRRGDIDYLIARKGELLPFAYERGASPLKTIIGARSDAQRAGGRPIPGMVWPGADIRAGLELLALVSTRPWRDQVAGIDVTDYVSKRQLAILTTSGGRIVWGGAPSDSVPGQVSAEVKLKRLDVLQHQFGAIDARHRIVEVAGPRTLVDDSATANAS